MRRAHHRTGFTLIELLVVITIIVVLLALLMPAMDRAIYQAELAVCGGRLKAGALGLQQYAMNSKRAYPYRAGTRDKTLNWSPSLLANRLYDDRPVIFSALKPLFLLDPLGVQPNIETNVPDNYITCNYDLWFDWVYVNDKGRGMHRVGDRFTFNGRRYNLLITDSDMITGHETTAPDGRYEGGTHPDRAGVMFKQGPYNDAVNPWVGWNSHGAFATWGLWSSQQRLQARGPVDMNFGLDDGAVLRMTDVVRDDPRVDNLSWYNIGTSASLPDRRLQVPRP